jgi:hypothetical protein
MNMTNMQSTNWWSKELIIVHHAMIDCDNWTIGMGGKCEQINLTLVLENGLYDTWKPLPKIVCLQHLRSISKRSLYGISVSRIAHVCGIWKSLLENGLCGILISWIGHVSRSGPL